MTWGKPPRTGSDSGASGLPTSENILEHAIRVLHPAQCSKRTPGSHGCRKQSAEKQPDKGREPRKECPSRPCIPQTTSELFGHVGRTRRASHCRRLHAPTTPRDLPRAKASSELPRHALFFLVLLVPSSVLAPKLCFFWYPPWLWQSFPVKCS